MAALTRALVLLSACTAPCDRAADSEAPAPPDAPPAITVPPDDLPPTAKVPVWQEMADDAVLVRSEADGGGTVELLEAPEVTAGSIGRWQFRYTAGALGVAEGGSLTFQTPPFWGWTPPQTRAPSQPGFTTWATEADGVTLEVDVPAQGMVRAVIGGRALAAGETVTLVYGEGAGAQADRYAERQETFGFAVDGDGDGIRGWVARLPEVDVGPRPTWGLWVTAPTTARPGEPFDVTIACLDARGNPAVDLAGEVVTLQADGVGPGEVTLDENGRARVTFTKDQAGLLSVRASVGEFGGASDPVVVHPEAPRIAWADLQIHTGLSDGTGTLDDVYTYARDVAGLDAVAITDHDHWGLRFLDREPALWSDVVATAARWDDPGTFVAFPAYEWTSWLYGHRHVLYVGEPGPVYGSLDVDTRDPAGLWAALEGHDALTIAHHSAGGPVAVDWRFPPPPNVEPVTELVSVHGSSESDDTPGRIYSFVPGNTVRDALARGYQLGFIGSTDGHDGHPGLAQLQGPSGGLAAIFVDELTREGVASALRARRAYATNGARLLLRTKVDGVPMGGEVPVTGNASTVEVRVVAGARVRRVELVRNGTVVAGSEPDSPALRETFALPPLEVGTYVYARVWLDGGGMAWSSPVWAVE